MPAPSCLPHSRLTGSYTFPVPYRSHRRCAASIVTVALCTAIATGCSSQSAAPDPERIEMTPVSTIDPGASPLRPGNATRIVADLIQASGAAPVTKIDITKTQVSLTVNGPDGLLTWTWSRGIVSTSDTQSTQVSSTPFDPTQFALDKVPSILATAARLAGSESNQSLQIVEYNAGTVLMTVTTRPETRPVFFRADGSVINVLDFTTTQGMAEGLKDAVGASPLVRSITFDPAHGIVVDAPEQNSTASQNGKDLVIRRTRSAKLPVWSVPRQDDSPADLFSPTDVDPAVLAALVDANSKDPKNSDVPKLSIDMSHGTSLPTITVDVGDAHTVHDLQGRDITNEVT